VIGEGGVIQRLLSCNYLGIVPHILLFLQATHSIDIKGMESTRVIGLIRWQFLLAGFQANTSMFTNANNNHLRRTLAGGIFLFWESNADFRDRAGRGTGGILHEVALLIEDHDRIGLIGGNCQTAVVVGWGLAVIDWEQGLLLHSLAFPAKDEKTSDQSESEENENQKGDEKVDHWSGETIVVTVVASNDSRNQIDHIGGC